jgi:hypothetical protein
MLTATQDLNIFLYTNASIGAEYMTKVKCSVDEIELTGDNGCEVAGVMASCPRCGHETESFGTGDASIRRCLVLMREECPNEERNFYEES